MSVSAVVFLAVVPADADLGRSFERFRETRIFKIYRNLKKWREPVSNLGVSPGSKLIARRVASPFKRALKEVMSEASDRLGESFSAFGKENASEILKRNEKWFDGLGGRLVVKYMDEYLLGGRGQKAVESLRSAKEKVSSAKEKMQGLVKKIAGRVSGAGKGIAALADDSRNGIFAKKAPLPVVTKVTKAPSLEDERNRRTRGGSVSGEEAGEKTGAGRAAADEKRSEDEAALVIAYARDCWNESIDQTSSDYAAYKRILERNRRTGVTPDCRGTSLKGGSDNSSLADSMSESELVESEREQILKDDDEAARYQQEEEARLHGEKLQTIRTRKQWNVAFHSKQMQAIDVREREDVAFHSKQMQAIDAREREDAAFHKERMDALRAQSREGAASSTTSYRSTFSSAHTNQCDALSRSVKIKNALKAIAARGKKEGERSMASLYCQGINATRVGIWVMLQCRNDPKLSPAERQGIRETLQSFRDSNRKNMQSFRSVVSSGRYSCGCWTSFCAD